MKDAIMMNLLWIVVGLSIFSTLGILYYSCIWLPKQIQARIRQSIKAYGAAIELRFPKHKGITERTTALAQIVGRRMQLSARQLQRLETAALLRDIGLCAVPYALVNHKSNFEWTDADWATYHRHADVSGAMLELVPSLRDLAPIVRLHHSDYRSDAIPSRDDIPIEARILKVVCDFVWFSRTQGTLLARDAILRDRGTQYDERVVDALLQALSSNRVESPRERTLVTH